MAAGSHFVMTPYTYFIASSGIYALLEFEYLPGLESRLAIDRSLAATRASGAYAGLGFLRSAALLASLSSALVILWLWVSNLFGAGHAAAVAQGGLENFDRAKFSLFLRPICNWRFVGALTLVAAALAYERGKVRWRSCFAREYDRQRLRVQLQSQRSQCVDLPETAEMVQVAQRLRQLETDPTSEIVAAQPADSEMTARRDYMKALLQQQYREADIDRRIDLTLTAKQTASHGPKTRREKVLMFFMGPVLFTSTRRTGRILVIVALLLLMLSFIGIQFRSTHTKSQDSAETMSAIPPRNSVGSSQPEFGKTREHARMLLPL